MGKAVLQVRQQTNKKKTRLQDKSFQNNKNSQKRVLDGSRATENRLIVDKFMVTEDEVVVDVLGCKKNECLSPSY